MQRAPRISATRCDALPTARPGLACKTSTLRARWAITRFCKLPGISFCSFEAIHEARIIPLDGRPHLPQTMRQWTGDSRGRWEGNTLIVETTNFSPKSSFMGSAENLRVVERFTRVAADTLKYEITLDDPTTWTKPWTVGFT